MSELYDKTYNPDVLSCLANLSNDEVFTPPEVANQMLDMLPKEIWSDPDATFLDPACKSGVFLREIAKRLIKGLEDVYPDLDERLEHIFKKQLYGVSITELTSLLSRRGVYCSKYPNSKYSVVEFDEAEGNIRFRRCEHIWVNRKCKYCGASQDEYDRESNLETHAYEFIHQEDPKDMFPMKFNVIAGNPPYQLSDGGGSGTSAAPIYQKFIQQSIKLNPRYLSMIVPSRWFSGGKGLDDFRNQMLHDDRLCEIHDYIEASDCFPGVQIKGGVCYFLWDRSHHGDCFVVTHRGDTTNEPMTRPLLEQGNDIFIRFNEAIPIFHKVAAKTDETLDSIISSRRPFGLSSKFRGHNSKDNGDFVLFQNGGQSYVSKNEIEDNGCADAWKVMIPFLGPGNDNFPHRVLGKPFISAPGEVCTETYLTIGPFGSEDECSNVISYLATRFLRFLVLLRKPSQNATRGVYSFVPMQDFSHPWTDEQLYEKYGIGDDEQKFIESLVKEMNLDDRMVRADG